MTRIGDEKIFIIKCDNCGKDAEPIEEPANVILYRWTNNAVEDKLNDVKYRSMHFCEKCYPLIQEMILDRSAADDGEK